MTPEFERELEKQMNELEMSVQNMAKKLAQDMWDELHRSGNVCADVQYFISRIQGVEFNHPDSGKLFHFA